MENVNKQLLDAASWVVTIFTDDSLSHERGSDEWLDDLKSAIAAAEKTQQAEPVGYVAPDELPGLKKGVCAFVYPKPDRHATQPVFAQPPAVAVPDCYVQGIEDAAMLCQKEADELLGENRHVRNMEAETKAEIASKLSEMLLSVAKDAAEQKCGA